MVGGHGCGVGGSGVLWGVVLCEVYGMFVRWCMWVGRRVGLGCGVVRVGCGCGMLARLVRVAHVVLTLETRVVCKLVVMHDQQWHIIQDVIPAVHPQGHVVLRLSVLNFM